MYSHKKSLRNSYLTSKIIMLSIKSRYIIANKTSILVILMLFTPLFTFSQVFNCDSAVILESGVTYYGNTADGQDSIDSHPYFNGGAADWQGKEVIHKITADKDGVVSMFLPGSSFTGYENGCIDLFVYPEDDSWLVSEWIFASSSGKLLGYDSISEGESRYFIVDTRTGCEEKEYTLTVTFPVNPTANFTATPTDGTAPLMVQFSDSSDYATGWSWDFGNGYTSNQKNPSHTYNNPGVYSVTLIVNNAYGVDTLTKTDYVDVDNTTSFKNTNDLNSIRIYPNPTKGTLRFENTNELNQIEIYDMLGKIVYQAKFKTEVDISNLNEGVYLLKLFDKEDKNILTQKIMLNK